jgi:hypothetical protein
MASALASFRQVWYGDFEFTAPPGERPTPICFVARELWSGRLERLWLADGAPDEPPFESGEDVLLVAYYASAELSCYLALDWPMPVRVLDLYPEFCNLTSGLPVPCGRGLLGALAAFGLDGLPAVEKAEWRQVAARGAPFAPEEQRGLLAYCQTDVDALAALLPAMLPKIDLPRALLRGRYMTAVARMEWAGVPIDLDTLDRLRSRWGRIKHRLIADVDQAYGVFIPAGQRTINPESVLGAAIFQTAAEWDIDPHRLADAVDMVWQAEREENADAHEARRAARKATGLTGRRIAQIEDAGRDYSHVRGLDVTARELAGELPALGIGKGYTSDDGVDDTDHAAKLWHVLRNYNEEKKPKHHADILRQAAELVFEHGRDRAEHFGAMRFSTERWAAYLTRKNIPWPRLPTGALALGDDAFREMARTYPAEVGPIRELRYALSQMRLNELQVGADGRNRFMVSAFASKTGRNQPSNTKSIFGPSCWLRSLIKPAPGRAVAYVDWSAQELAIAAALSGDPVMQDAYRSGDPYIYLARKAGGVPADATKKTHPTIREQFKVVSLGVLYGLSADGLARKLAVPPCRGRELLRLHQETFKRFWQWSDRVEMEAMLGGTLQTVFGWKARVGADANPRSLRNFPMQANGAEMMRLACCLATERGIMVCCPVHDALLVEGPVDEIDDVVSRTQDAMQEASELVLPGFPLRTDAKIVRYPDRYSDERGQRMWETVVALLDGHQEGGRNGAVTPGTGARGPTPLTPSTGARGDEWEPLAPAPGDP